MCKKCIYIISHLTNGLSSSIGIKSFWDNLLLYLVFFLLLRVFLSSSGSGSLFLSSWVWRGGPSSSPPQPAPWSPCRLWLFLHFCALEDHMYSSSSISYVICRMGTPPSSGQVKMTQLYPCSNGSANGAFGSPNWIDRSHPCSNTDANAPFKILDKSP
jgi:hypothetical protein